MLQSNAAGAPASGFQYNAEAAVPAKRVYRESCSTQTFYRWLEKFGASQMGAVRVAGGRWLLYPSQWRAFLAAQADVKQGTSTEKETPPISQSTGS